MIRFGKLPTTAPFSVLLASRDEERDRAKSLEAELIAANKQIVRLTQEKDIILSLGVIYERLHNLQVDIQNNTPRARGHYRRMRSHVDDVFRMIEDMVGDSY